MAIIGTVLPADLLDPGRQDDAMLFIAILPLDSADKKRMVVEWVNFVGAVLTADMVTEAGAE